MHLIPLSATALVLAARSWLRLRAARPPEQRLWMLLRMRDMQRETAVSRAEDRREQEAAARECCENMARQRAEERAQAAAGAAAGFRFLFLRRRPAGRYPLVALPSLPLLLKRRKSNSPGARPPLRAPGLFSMCRHKRQRRTGGFGGSPLSPDGAGAQIIGKPADPNGRKGCPASKGQQNDRILYSAAADMPEHGAGVRILQNLFGLPPLFFWGQGAVFRRIFDHAGYEMVQMDPIELLEVLFRPHIHFPDIGFFRFVSLFTQLKEMRVVGRNQRFPGRLAITV